MGRCQFDYRYDIHNLYLCNNVKYKFYFDIEFFAEKAFRGVFHDQSESIEGFLLRCKKYEFYQCG